jgi:PleD family two-component response regulator
MIEQAGETELIEDGQKSEEKIASLVEPEALEGKIIVAVEDMFFAAKILGAAQRVGRQVDRVKTKEELTEAAANPAVALIIMDLNSAQLQALDIIETFKSDPTLAAIPILGFLSHLQVDLKHRAEELGCDYVMPRSAFSQTLPDILSGKMPGSSTKSR